MLVLLLITLSLLGIVFVLGPLLMFRRRHIAPGRESVGILIYFAGIGLGFMLLEISLIQKFVLFLGYPTYSLSVTLFSLLIFLGCGSFLSRRWVGRERLVLPLGVLAIALITLFYSTGLPIIQERLLGASLFVRIIVSVGVLAPLGIVLGGFFPLGIRRAAALDENLVPWAWGVNGCASVTATVLTVLLAMSHGFQRVWILSLAVYAVAVAALLLTTTGSGSTSSPDAASS